MNPSPSRSRQRLRAAALAGAAVLVVSVLGPGAPAPEPVSAVAAPTYDPANKNDLLRSVVLAKATDGYAAVVSMGEISPDFGATPVLLALRQDGQSLERPRLAVRGDVRGGRYVTDLKTLRVVRVG